MKNHRSPALSVMMIFSDLCIRSTLDSYREQGWEISEKRSGLVLRSFVATHRVGRRSKSRQRIISVDITAYFRCKRR
jgi:hypothetical protein